MNDHYYQHEEDVITVENELDTMDATRKALVVDTQITADQVSRSADITQYLYPLQGTAEQAALVSEQHETISQLATRITQYDLAYASTAAFAHRMFEMHQQLAGSMEKLADEKDFLEGKLSNKKQQLKKLEAEFNDTMKTAYQEIFTEMHESIRELTGCGEWALVHRLTDMLVGNTEPSDYQRQLLSELLSTFVEEPES